MPSPEVTAYIAGSLIAALLAYVSKRVLNAADRIDDVTVTIERHEHSIKTIFSNLARGRQRMDAMDEHLRSTDATVSNARQDIARLEGAQR